MINDIIVMSWQTLFHYPLSFSMLTMIDTYRSKMPESGRCRQPKVAGHFDVGRFRPRHSTTMTLMISLAGDTVKVLEELDDFALPPPEQGDNFRTAKFKSRVVED